MINGMQKVTIVIITGLSGSGKSTAIRALEDLDFFCIDNLPPILLPTFLELCEASSVEIKRIAVVMDVRERAFLKEYPDIFRELKEKGQEIKILFLESSDEILIRRFKETRRQHPLAPQETVLEGIQKERALLADLRMLATEILDTSNISIHQLRSLITNLFQDSTEKKQMTIVLTSFGFKFGIPYDADIVMDVRFLPNPFFVSELRHLSGNDTKIHRYVMNNETAKRFQKRFYEMINFLVPLYEKEGKPSLTIGVGCTGGHHRSVAVINNLKKLLSKKKYPLRLIHRDLGKT